MTQSGCSAAFTEPFALRVIGDSMAPEFLDGHIILVDPGYPVYDGAFVVVDYGGEVLFGQYAHPRDQSHATITYLNEAFQPILLVPPFSIKGVIIERVGKRRKDRKQYGSAV